MCRSLSCRTIAAAFVLALVLFTVPAQAQPRDLGSSLRTLDASWIDAALSWLGDLLGGGESEPLQSTATSTLTLPPGYGSLSGSCIDPQGHCGPGGGGGPI